MSRAGCIQAWERGREERGAGEALRGAGVAWRGAGVVLMPLATTATSLSAMRCRRAAFCSLAFSSFSFSRRLLYSCTCSMVVKVLPLGERKREQGSEEEAAILALRQTFCQPRGIL